MDRAVVRAERASTVMISVKLDPQSDSHPNPRRSEGACSSTAGPGPGLGSARRRPGRRPGDAPRCFCSLLNASAAYKAPRSGWQPRLLPAFARTCLSAPQVTSGPGRANSTTRPKSMTRTMRANLIAKNGRDSELIVTGWLIERAQLRSDLEGDVFKLWLMRA
jgi:hypothetical protein